MLCIILCSFGLVLWSLLVYSPSLRGDFTGDDSAVLFREPHVLRGEWWHVLTRYTRGITDATFALTFKLFKGREIFVCHLTNNLMHGVNAILAFAILQSLSFNLIASLMGALAFTSYPLAVNAVANIAGRYSLMATLFSFAGLLAALTLPPWAGVPVLTVCWMLALWCKPDTALLPALASVLSGQWWYVLLYLPPLCWVLWYWRHYLIRLTEPKQYSVTGLPGPMPRIEYGLTFVYESIRRWPLWLLGLGHSISPFVKPASRARSIISCLIAGFLLIASLIWMPMFVKIVLLSFLLSPWSLYSVMPLTDPILEHRAYTNILPLSLIVASSLAVLPLWLIGLFIVWLALRAAWRSGAWDGGRLWYQAYADGSRKPTVLLNLSTTKLMQNDLEGCEALCQEVLEEVPNSGHALFNLMQCAFKRGNGAQALQYGNAVLERCPKWEDGHKLVARMQKQIFGGDA